MKSVKYAFMPFFIVVLAHASPQDTAAQKSDMPLQTASDSAATALESIANLKQRVKLAPTAN